MTGWRREPEMCVRTSCRMHLWLTVTGPNPVDYACGFVQSAECVVCGIVTPLLDADWWYEKASPEQVGALIEHLHGERARLARVIDGLVSQGLAMKGTGDGTLRNYE